MTSARTSNDTADSTGSGTGNVLTNYVAYQLKESGESRIGHLDLQSSQITPLAFSSGAFITDLYQVIEIGESNIIPSGDKIDLRSVKLLAPIYGRDILAVGKNYSEHAKEFNASGFDSSDKIDQPTHPVIFTKRATSIIADGEDIYPHPGFTDTVDFEGEIGVIIGKSGFKISEADAPSYVWGYTIINDMTARERQRDHKQFFIGKSPDTFCPMGPIAVPASRLPKNLHIQTHVNGEKQQDATIDDLIFSVPFLIKTISEGQTLQLGDVIATGTPAGVGIGRKPPVYLQPGDIVSVSVSGLGTLHNKIASPDANNYTVARVSKATHIPTSNTSKVPGGIALLEVNGKKLYYSQLGDSSKPPILFIHGLGGSSEFYAPLVSALGLAENYSLHFMDLEGHGLSPTSAASTVSIASYAADFVALATKLNIKNAMIFGHSMGCLVALTLAIEHPEILSQLILIGPVSTPVPEAGRNGANARALIVRQNGVRAVVDAITSASTSAKSQKENPVGIAAVRMSLLGQDPEGYAKGCSALAGVSEALDLSKVKAKTLIISGDEDKVSPVVVCDAYQRSIADAELQVLHGVGHWHIFEDVFGVAKAINSFI